MKKATLKDLRDTDLRSRVRISVDQEGLSTTLTGELDEVGFRRWDFGHTLDVVYSVTVGGNTLSNLGPLHEIELL